MRQTAAQAIQQHVACYGAGLALVFCTQVVQGFAYDPLLMKGRNVYVKLERDTEGNITSTTIAPDPSDPSAWTAPTYPSTYQRRTVEQEADRSGCRSYAIFIPRSYDGSPLPLHLSLHGNGGTGTVAAGNHQSLQVTRCRRAKAVLAAASSGTSYCWHWL